MSPLSVSAPVKAVAFLVFVAALAGATWGVQSVIGDDVVLQSVSTKAVRAELNATAGHAVTYAVTVTNHGESESRMSVRLAGVGFVGESSSSALVPAKANRTLFVTVEVPDTLAPGTYPLRLDVLDASGKLLRTRESFATLRVLENAPGFVNGDSARVLYAGRLADSGLVFNTNDPALLGLPFPQADIYRPSPNALAVQSLPRPSVVDGFFEGLMGMQPGETRTVTFGPDKGYGAALEESTEKRLEELERVFELDITVEQVSRDVFNEYVSSSGQGEGTDFDVGDVFTFTQGPNKWPYRIVAMSATIVDYELHVEAGMRFTLYPFWEDASEVTAVDDEHVTFVTTPTTEVGETFTMRTYWPSMTSVSSVDADTIVVRHDPPAGLKYSVPQGATAPARDYTVVSVSDEGIVVSTPSQNPLAGKTLSFDIHLLELTKG